VRRVAEPASYNAGQFPTRFNDVLYEIEAIDPAGDDLTQVYDGLAELPDFAGATVAAQGRTATRASLRWQGGPLS